MPPNFDPIFEPWTFLIRYYDSEWNELPSRTPDYLTTDQVARRLNVWRDCQKKKLEGQHDTGNPYYNVALIEIEVQHG